MVFTGSQADLDRLRQSFERDHFVLLADFLDSALVSVVLPHVQRAEYQSAAYKGIGSELRMAKNPALDVLFFLANGLRLFGLVQAITGCGHIGSFEGRIYKLISHPQHNFDWHDDLRDTSRLIALSLNLGTEPFRGGFLQIRETRPDGITSEIANTGFGNAVLFQVSSELQHRVTPVEGDVARTSFAGWFKSAPDFHSQMKRQGQSDAT